MLWTDETKMEVFGDNQRGYAQHLEKNAVKSGGGSVMLGGLGATAAPGNLGEV